MNMYCMCRCEEHGIPVVFALTRKKMGELFGHRRVFSLRLFSVQYNAQFLASLVADCPQDVTTLAPQGHVLLLEIVVHLSSRG